MIFLSGDGVGENDKGAVLSPGPVPEKAEATNRYTIKPRFTDTRLIRTRYYY